MVKVLWYLLFLLAYGAWFGLTWAMARTARTRVMATASFPYFEAASLVASIMIYICIFLLTRFSNVLIAGFYFISTQVSGLIRVTIGEAAPGPSARRHLAEKFWAATCFSFSHYTFTTFIMGPFAIMLASGYPLIAGITYFASPVPSTRATLIIIRVTLSYLLVLGTVIQWPLQFGISLSENLSRPARRRILISSVANLLPLGTLLATLLWTFDVPTGDKAHSALGFRLAYSSLTFFFLLAYFIVIMLVPYAIGVVRGSQRQTQLLKQHKELLARLIRVLRIPIAGFYAGELAGLSQELKQQRGSFIISDGGITLGLLLDRTDKGELSPAVAAAPFSQVVRAIKAEISGTSIDVKHVQPEPLSPVEKLYDLLYAGALRTSDRRPYRVARSADPRFQHIDWMDSLLERLAMTTSDLLAKSDDAERVAGARAWAESYEEDRRDLAEQETPGSTFAALATSAVVTTLASVFFTGFGNWLWTQVAHTLPK